MTLGKSSVNVSHNESEPADDVIEVQKCSVKRKAEKDKQEKKGGGEMSQTAKNWQSSFMEMLENTQLSEMQCEKKGRKR